MAKTTPKKITSKNSKSIVKQDEEILEDNLEQTDIVEDANQEDVEVEEEPKLKSRSSSIEDIIEDGVKDEVYLRQYQYKKVNNIPTIGGVLTDPDKGSKAEVMKAFLLKQPKVSIMIPLEPGSDPKVLYSVTRNGYRLDLPTNTYTEVPVPVAEMIRDSNNQTVAAINQYKIDAGTNKDNALN